MEENLIHAIIVQTIIILLTILQYFVFVTMFLDLIEVFLIYLVIFVHYISKQG